VTAHLYAFIAPAAAGKSTTAALLRARIPDLVVVSSDVCRARCSPYGEENDQDATADAIRLLHHEVDHALAAGRQVLVDATNSQPEHRATLLTLADRHHAGRTAIVLLPPVDTVLARNARRSAVPGRSGWPRRVPEAVVIAMHHRISAAVPQLPAVGRQTVIDGTTYPDLAAVFQSPSEKAKPMITNNELEYTAPEVFTTGVAEGWADRETDPTQIDWTERKNRAAIQFRVVNSRPVNPVLDQRDDQAPVVRPAVRYGRNHMGHWGEACTADAYVTVTDPQGVRWLLMIERDDDHGWALPGGHVDPGESTAEACVRELLEEATLDLIGHPGWVAGTPRHVDDPRGSGEAWIVTTVFSCDLGRLTAFPTVVPGSDARRAEWVRADSYPALVTEISTRYGGKVFTAHDLILREALG
jgi:ADP-ribose pyrophosphatase